MPDVTMFEVKEDFQQLQWCAENKALERALPISRSAHRCGDWPPLYVNVEDLLG